MFSGYMKLLNSVTLFLLNSVRFTVIFEKISPVNFLYKIKLKPFFKKNHSKLPWINKIASYAHSFIRGYLLLYIK